MYRSLEIKDFGSSNLSVDRSKKDAFRERNKTILNGLERYLLKEDNVLNATEIQKHLFPEVNADIFLSHAHADEDQVISLAVYLEEMGFDVFVDSCVWGNAFDLLKEIDEKHCKHAHGETYSYQKRNFSTANIYMILNAALHRMIEKSELFIFLGTESSLTIEDSIENQKFLKSPWIFSELTFVNQVCRYDLRQNMRPIVVKKSLSIEDAQVKALDESLQIRYVKPVLDFSLPNQIFAGWLIGSNERYRGSIISQYKESLQNFSSCKPHIEWLEVLYELMKEKGEKREETLYQQRMYL